jgi:hypothetical protein
MVVTSASTFLQGTDKGTAHGARLSLIPYLCWTKKSGAGDSAVFFDKYMTPFGAMEGNYPLGSDPYFTLKLQKCAEEKRARARQMWSRAGLGRSKRTFHRT